LHLFHISTGAEANLFSVSTNKMDKRVTAEACIHHLWFNDSDYENLGPLIKWNPSIKSEENRIQLIQALKDGRLDIIASDHAPHSSEEKVGTYDQIKSGAPIVQHTMPLLFQIFQKGEINIEFIVEKTSHRVADIYKIQNRGYLREGFFADLIEVDFNSNDPWRITQDSLLYKSGWSPLLGEKLSARIKRTFVNGNLIFENDIFVSDTKGQRLMFSKIR
jgi:dihydroorotase